VKLASRDIRPVSASAAGRPVELSSPESFAGPKRRAAFPLAEANFLLAETTFPLAESTFPTDEDTFRLSDMRFFDCRDDASGCSNVVSDH
jgi:hypothetical protein